MKKFIKMQMEGGKRASKTACGATPRDGFKMGKRWDENNAPNWQKIGSGKMTKCKRHFRRTKAALSWLESDAFDDRKRCFR